MTTKARDRDREGAARGNGGGPKDPNKQGTRISVSSKGGPRGKRISIFPGRERENIGKEERGGRG